MLGDLLEQRGVNYSAMIAKCYFRCMRRLGSFRTHKVKPGIYAGFYANLI